MADYENRKKILDEINAERDYQVHRWGNEADDTLNDPHKWQTWLSFYSTKWTAGEFKVTPQMAKDFRECMIKVAAIATAAVESYDRQVEENGKPFYQSDD